MESSNVLKAVNQQGEAQKIQIYSNSKTGVSPFWRDKYERDAKKYWDVFYKRHQDRIGCGAGNTIFPLIATYPDVFVHACDFSPRAINLVKTHKEFTETRIDAFVCDLTADDLSKHISPSSINIVTMIFVLSAVSPEKMPSVLQNIRKVLKPSGYVLFRDYAVGDLAQERLTDKDQKISENFYVRGDGTRAFYFSNDFLMSLFKENGFDVKEIGLCCKQVENRSRELVMNRRWVQAVFCFSDGLNSSFHEETSSKVDLIGQEVLEPHSAENALGLVNNFEVDISEGLAFDMFGISPSDDKEMIEVKLKGCSFKIKVLSKEYQHTCRSTGLMLWESARLMAAILARNPTFVAGKRVLELGSGCAGICSMAAVGSADLVVATDGDQRALDLLTENVTSNLTPPILSKLITKRLEWGNRDHIEAIKDVNNGGFEIILGTDVTYIAEAILPLFATAKELISPSNKGNREDQQPALILCHVFRRVDEPSILSAASQCGFRIIDKWPVGNPADPCKSIISSWFPKNDSENDIPCSALNIMYFQVE
ncbi:uncharacterized protein LOC123212703 isoform X3 [Mangifera indica]|uniref:uncharacterized protein LOC123212703 isoform X3 n=1 Tax=Mangifera indica TaxID=29780 RepID=UPI001CFAFEEC|nr:uncharacterized protein LOC123212703 isoform X3 [Mangifera indica]